MEHIGEKRPNIVFETATEKDIALLLEIENSVAGSRTYSPMLTAEEWKEALEKGVVHLIKQNGKIVGNVSYEQEQNSLHITGIAIHPEFQGKGTGKVVLDYLLTAHPDIKRFDLVTHPDNPALRLYESLGFTVESRMENYYGDGEPRLALVLSRK